MPSLARAFPALRHRNFKLFITGQFLSLCGTWMQTIAQGWLVLQLTNSAFQVGLVSMLGSLPILTFTLYGGVLADRVNRRRAIFFLQGLMLLEALTLAVLTRTGVATVHWVMALALFLGTLTAFEVPIRQSFMIDMVGRADLMNAIALNSSAFNVSRIIGPAIAGALIAAVGIAACFFANAVSYLAVLASLFLMDPSAIVAPNRRTGRRNSFKEGVRYALGLPRPRALLLLTATFSVFGFSFLTMLPVLARHELGTGAAGYGGLMSAVGIGAGAGALGMAAFGKRLPRGRLIRWGGLLFGGSLLAIASVKVYWLAGLFLGAAGCAMILTNVMTNTLLQTEVPDHLRGRVMGFYSWTVLGMAPLGSFQAGWVSEHFGVRASLVVGGVVSLIATAAATYRLPVRRLS
ncbi:MAG: MFS transporter [Gemmatimonadales bacterium]